MIPQAFEERLFVHLEILILLCFEIRHFLRKSVWEGGEGAGVREEDGIQ